MTLAEEKQVQRKAGIAARRALAPETRAAANATLCARLAALPCFRQARTILLYAAFGGEADLVPLAETARGLGKTLAYPVCGGNFRGTLSTASAATSSSCFLRRRQRRNTRRGCGRFLKALPRRATASPTASPSARRQTG